MMEETEKILKRELGENLKFDEPLADHVSFGVGGPAQYYYTAPDVDDLVKAVSTAYILKLPYIVIGGGYNIIPSDRGFQGLVIRNKCSNIAFSGDTSEVIVDSGTPLSKLINLAASRDFGGLEFLYGVPGTVGGAVYGNAGSFNYEIGDFVKSVILLIPKDGKMTIVKRDNAWMEFAYRTSKLKKDGGENTIKPVLLTIKLQLVKRRRDEIIGFMQQNLKKKQLSQPLDEKSAGSFFKNPTGGTEGSAGYMLDQIGAKKLRMGGAAFSKKHANFLINRKNASATDIKELAIKAKELIREKYNKDLEEEVEYIGSWD